LNKELSSALVGLLQVFLFLSLARQLRCAAWNCLKTDWHKATQLVSAIEQDDNPDRSTSNDLALLDVVA
jgi:hypothetical protein